VIPIVVEGREQPISKRQEFKPEAERHDDEAQVPSSQSPDQLSSANNCDSQQTLDSSVQSEPRSVSSTSSSSNAEPTQNRCINIPIQVESGYTPSPRGPQFGNHSDSNLGHNPRINTCTPGQKPTSGIRPQYASYGNLSTAQRSQPPPSFGNNQSNANQGHYYPETFEPNANNHEQEGNSQAPQPPQQPQSSTQAKKPTSAIEQIEQILNEVQDWSSQIDTFQGTTGDKQYRYLDEYLTRSLLKLDQIETNGIQEIRLARKNAIVLIESVITKLENAGKSKTEVSSSEPSAECLEASKANDNEPAEEAKQDSDSNTK
jgi:hypothetical protein